MVFPVDPPFRAEHIGSLPAPGGACRAGGAVRPGGSRRRVARGRGRRDRQRGRAGRARAPLGERRGAAIATPTASAPPSSRASAPRAATIPTGATPTGRARPPAANVSVVADRLVWEGPANVADFAYLAALAPEGCVPKMTLPGPCHIHFRAGRGNIDRAAYPGLDSRSGPTRSTLTRRRSPRSTTPAAAISSSTRPRSPSSATRRSGAGWRRGATTGATCSTSMSR